MKSKTEDRTIRQKLAKFVSTSMAASLAVLIIVLGAVSIGFLINLTNELQDTETHAVQEEVAIWYAERMSEVRSIRDTMKNVVEKTESVHSHIAQIADSIREETTIVEDVSQIVLGIDDFAKETETTSKECVDMTKGLYDEVDTMHEIIGRFEL